MTSRSVYEFQAPLWRYDGKAAWYFITVPIEESAQIRFFAADAKSAWGSVPVRVAVGGSHWQTSLFPDRKAGAYLLPMKAAIRKHEGLEEGDVVIVTVELQGTL